MKYCYLVIDFIYLRKSTLAKCSEHTDLFPIYLILEDRESVTYLEKATLSCWKFTVISSLGSRDLPFNQIPVFGMLNIIENLSCLNFFFFLQELLSKANSISKLFVDKPDLAFSSLFCLPSAGVPRVLLMNLIVILRVSN